MPEKLIIGPITKGLRTDREPFIIDNDSFPTLINAYQWRGKLRKRRGTVFLGRLQRVVSSTDALPVMTLDISGNGTATLTTVFSLETTASIVPGSITFSDGTNIYSDNSSGTITGSPGGTGTINYATSVVTITGGAVSQPVIGVLNIVDNGDYEAFQYYPNLPVMGLEDFLLSTSNYPTLLALDTTYSYMFDSGTNEFFSTTFYKTTGNPALWHAQNYQQFWSTNYEGALWAVNADSGTTVGANFGTMTSVSASGSVLTFTLTNPYNSSLITNLIIGDVIWVNEVQAVTVANVNGFTATISDITGAASGIYKATYAQGITVTTYTAGTGIAQLLTNSLGYDGVRWYDGDPTENSYATGWVNFMPPLQNATVTNPQYLVGAIAMLAYKDRLLFFGPWVATSTSPTPIQYQDTVIYSWNGTPYYTVANTTTTTVSVPTLIPATQTASNVAAWYQNIIGFGGFISASIPQPIVTITNNEDVLLIGFTNKQTRLVYTGNDILPFIFYSINSELGSGSTFSGVTLDKGGITIGSYGIAMTDQTSARRIDLEIPDQIFTIPGTNNGSSRVCAIRDYRNEWIYFTVPSNQSDFYFPTQTLLFNYRENSWAIFNENYTTYGNYRPNTSYTWATLPYKTWAEWNEPWNSGTLTSDYPDIIGGNAQGFVLIRQEDGTEEDSSGYISAISVGSGVYDTMNLITSPNHCLTGTDFIYISGCLGTTTLNDTIFKVNFGDIDPATNFNQFYILPEDATFVPDSNTYLGAGVFTRLTNFSIQTKQFPASWSDGRKVRIGTQKYLFDTTSEGEVTTYLYVNQDADDPTNLPPYLPSAGATNDAVIYSAIVPTYPEIPTTIIVGAALGAYGDASTTSFSLNLFTILGISGVIEGSTTTITVGNPSIASFTDTGSGSFATVTGTAASGTIDYTTGAITLVFSTAPSYSNFNASLTYYYNLSGSSTLGSGQAQTWHRQSTSMIGDTVQIGISLSDAQMYDLTISESEMTLHAIVIDLSPGPTLAGGLFG